MKNAGSVRIIGGLWRSRRLRFPATAGLRPTADAVRETLFNWIAPDLPGASCLDLYAGSGALGFEAASRGAGRTILVETNRQAARALLANRDMLDAGDRIEVIQQPALSFLARTDEQFDLVFLDPPFDRGHLGPVLELLGEGDRLAAGARIYIESPWHGDPLPIPRAWHIIREKRSGMVKSTLVQS